MVREDFIQLLASVRDEVSPVLRKKIEEILALCEPYRSQGKAFSFAANPDLDKKVNDALILLSDEIIHYIEHKAEQIANEDDYPAIIAYLHRDYNGTNLTESVDRYSSQLKYFVEGYLAIGFANKVAGHDILSQIWTYMGNPYASPLYQGARNLTTDILALQAGGLKIGSGHTKSILDGLALIGQNAINEAFQFQTVLDFRKNDDIIGYKVFRGSSYDCDVCDELTYGIHPVTEIVLPSHPHCMCYAVPVYAHDRELFED